MINNYKQFKDSLDKIDILDIHKPQRIFCDMTIDNREYFISGIKKEQLNLIIYDFLLKPFVLLHIIIIIFTIQVKLLVLNWRVS